MSFVIIPRESGVITHLNVDLSEINLPDNAEIFDDEDDFYDRLSDFD